MKFNRRWLAIAPLIVAIAARAGSSSPPRPAAPVPSGASGSITVWVDAVRLPAAKAYVKAHPNVNVKIVTFDGDGNGATTLQAKIQLWNRTGNGLAGVIFSEQANDPVWMASKPFDYAAPVWASSRRRSSRAGPRRRAASARSTARRSASRTTWRRTCSGTTRS